MRLSELLKTRKHKIMQLHYAVQRYEIALKAYYIKTYLYSHIHYNNNLYRFMQQILQKAQVLPPIFRVPPHYRKYFDAEYFDILIDEEIDYVISQTNARRESIYFMIEQYQ